MAARHGFTPLRHVHGHVDFKTHWFKTYTDNASNNRTIMVGDVVMQDPAGHIDIWPRGATRYTAASVGPLGVVVDIANADGRPLTFNQPNSGVIVPVSTSAMIGVLIDPGVTYSVHLDTSLQQTDHLAFAKVTGLAGVTAVGRSGQLLTNISASASSATPFQILGVAPLERGVAVSGQDVEVMLVKSQLGRNSLTAGD